MFDIAELNKKLATVLLGLLAILVPYTSHAQIKPGSLFQDHMVLQRDMPVPVWGSADPGTQVSVQFAGQKKTTHAGKDGKWMIRLDPLTSSFEPGSMTISSPRSEDKIQISDILVGEVWICAGQSNMQMSLASVPDLQALTPDAENIRSFTVKNTVSFEAEDNCGGEWISSYPNSAVAFGFSFFLEKAADVPVGIILTAWASSSIEAWMPRDMTATVPHFKVMMEDFDADTATHNRISAILAGPRPWPKADDIFLRRQSNILYNAMMHPLIPYACRGIAWYQGERNTQSMYGMKETPWWSKNSGMLKYGEVLKQWIVRYREEWHRDDLQFIIVMLPGYAGKMKEGPEDPDAPSWAWMRESQLKALELPHTGVVNTIDLGDAKKIHPTDKLPLTKRMALLAEDHTLGKHIESMGPMMKIVKVKRNKLIVHFTHAEGLQTTDSNPPSAFWLADDSGQWVSAEAKIRGRAVVLRSDELKKPLYVRYAFAGKPKVNLINGAGMPAYPFRTDAFVPRVNDENQ